MQSDSSTESPRFEACQRENCALLQPHEDRHMFRLDTCLSFMLLTLLNSGSWDICHQNAEVDQKRKFPRFYIAAGMVAQRRAERFFPKQNTS